MDKMINQIESETKTRFYKIKIEEIIILARKVYQKAFACFPLNSDNDVGDNVMLVT